MYRKAVIHSRQKHFYSRIR